jgi:hypothetical protein
MSSEPSNLDNPLKKCSACNSDKVCKFAKFHSSPSKGDTTKKRRKYTDETGRLWHGTRCPDCAADWRKDRAGQAESKKQEALKKLLAE